MKNIIKQPATEVSMSPTLQALGIDRLSVADRIALVQEIWDSIAVDAERAPLTEEQKQEVDRRLAAHRADPQAAISWEKVEAEALARLGK
jgi:putative addiction module component (TIGR02574 family)